MFESISQNQVFAIIAFSLVFIGYVGYYFSAKNDKADHDNRPTKEVINMRVQGFIWMGVIPFLCMLVFSFLSDYSFADFGAPLAFPIENVYWILGFAALLIPLNFLNAPRADNLHVYPQIREKNWDSALQCKEYFTWFIYLLAYEWLFRGVFYFGSRQIMEFLPALVLNTSIYALVHLPKGLKETLWSIPLGVLLCILVDRTGVFYGAVIIHFLQAASSSFFSLRAHPDMKIVKS